MNTIPCKDCRFADPIARGVPGGERFTLLARCAKKSTYSTKGPFKIPEGAMTTEKPDGQFVVVHLNAVQHHCVDVVKK